MVGAWLHEAEDALRQEVIVQQAHEVTASTVHRALEQHKVSWDRQIVADTYIVQIQLIRKVWDGSVS